MRNMCVINLSCCRGPSSISSGDLNKVATPRAGVIIGQDSDLHLQEKQNQENGLTLTQARGLLPLLGSRRMHGCRAGHGLESEGRCKQT